MHNSTVALRARRSLSFHTVMRFGLHQDRVKMSNNSGRISQLYDCELWIPGSNKKQKLRGDSGSGRHRSRAWFLLSLCISLFFTCTRRQSSRCYCSASELFWLFIDLERKGYQSQPFHKRHTVLIGIQDLESFRHFERFKDQESLFKRKRAFQSFNLYERLKSKYSPSEPSFLLVLYSFVA